MCQNLSFISQHLGKLPVTYGGGLHANIKRDREEQWMITRISIMVAGTTTKPWHRDERGGPRWCCACRSMRLGAAPMTAAAAGRRWWCCGGDDGG